MKQDTIQIEEKLEALINELTLDEKIGMIHGNGLFQTKGVERLGIPPLKMSDGPMGVRNEFKNDSWNAIGNSDDFVTYLPCNSALASTWNIDLAKRLGRVLGKEARGRGKDVILAPGVSIMRSPICGRNFEYMSEDPYLTSKTAVPLIQGIQESDVAACVKHFAANNQETQRLWVDVEVDKRALYEIYFPAFLESINEGGSHSIMGAYNLLYGEHCCQSKYLLNNVLREEWKYDGCVISDWGGVHATKDAAESGLDIEMSVTNHFDEYYMANPLKKEIEEGRIQENLVDEKVRRILRMMDKLHMLGGKRCSGGYNLPEHRREVLEIARESIVLLKNEDQRLPLKKEGLKKLLVIGDNAERIHSNGGGSAEIKPLYEISPLLGLKMKLGGNLEVQYAKGYDVQMKKDANDTNWQEISLEKKTDESQSESTQSRVKQEEKEARSQQLLEEAVMLARDAEEVILFAGLNHDYDTEEWDRKDMSLPYGQDRLIQEVLKVQPNTIVVIVAGSPVEMTGFIEDAKTVVWSWYAGMEGGTALAEVLLGETNPSGKLPMTLPKKLEDCSAHSIGEFPGGKTVAYHEGIFVGYRHYDRSQIEPEFCFGHGLSYTTFTYQNLQLHVEEKEDLRVQVIFQMTNTGKMAGSETAQLYVAPKQASVERPVQELKGYKKVNLQPGQIEEIRIELDTSAFAFYDEKKHCFRVEEGEYEIRVGTSSRECNLLGKIKIGTGRIKRIDE